MLCCAMALSACNATKNQVMSMRAAAHTQTSKQELSLLAWCVNPDTGLVFCRGGSRIWQA